MKRGKLILASLAFIVALGGAFAFKANQKFASANIFVKSGSSYSPFGDCYYPQETGQTDCSTINNLGSNYYYEVSAGVYDLLPVNGSVEVFTVPGN